MTPTLVGRWQTRLAMLGTLGLLVTGVFALGYGTPIFFWVLLWVLVFGLGWDVVFILLQALRWDRDWPAAFQVGSAIIEGAFVYAVITIWGLPGVPQGLVPLDIFIAHYGTVWLVTFIWVQGPMRVLFPFWRFHGGRIVPAVVSSPALRAARTGETAPASAPSERPGRLAAAAVILILFGLLAAAGGLVLAVGASQLTSAFAAMPDFGAIAAAVGVSVLVVGLLELLAGIGILFAQGWARILGLILGVLGVVGSVVGLVSPLMGAAAGDAGSLAVSVIVLVAYLVVVVSLIGAGDYFAARRSATG